MEVEIMKIATLLKASMISIGCIILSLNVNADDVDNPAMTGLTSAKSGTVVCGGFYRQNFTHRARWAIRNFNEEYDINVDRIRLYDKFGDLKIDTLIDPSNPSIGIPPDRNGILGPGQSVLAAHQTALYISEDLPPISLNPNGPGNVQVVMDWSAEQRVIPPSVVLVRHVYDATGTILYARSSGECRSVRYRQDKESEAD